jgi:hypothetical protein
MNLVDGSDTAETGGFGMATDGGMVGQAINFQLPVLGFPVVGCFFEFPQDGVIHDGSFAQIQAHTRNPANALQLAL